MASLGHGSSPWKKRAMSLTSQDPPEDYSSSQHVVSSPRTAPRSSAHLSDNARQHAAAAASRSYREPIRSFVHGTVREDLAGPVDSVQSVRSVRQDTAALANYLLADKKDVQSVSFLNRARPHSPSLAPSTEGEAQLGEAGLGRLADTIPEAAEPSWSEETEEHDYADGHSILGKMLQQRRPHQDMRSPGLKDDRTPENVVAREETSVRDVTEDDLDDDTDEHPEMAPLLSCSWSRETRTTYGTANESVHYHDLEQQKRRKRKPWLGSWIKVDTPAKNHAHRAARAMGTLRTVDRGTLWRNVVVAPAACLPSAIVGVLLNILDALSYGMILFPLGNPIFENLGSAGISIFYVSTIIAQLTYSCGSVFKGGMGSELIEVIPFFHSMAATITDIVGESKPEAVIATTITSYALSSMMTGATFCIMGKFKFGYIVGFIPRHILIGCIGGVGWFLVATGFEVTARMDGSLNYDLDTLHRLTRADTVPLWILPLVLAVTLFYGQQKIRSKYFLPLYVCAIPLFFYFFVLALDAMDPDTLRSAGWIFKGPPSGEPWWYFWTLYQFDKVHWGAILQCIPAMLALTFFGILHVPINVPALALQTGEDHVDLDRELKLHGYSNFFSGMAGSIQNYLVFANTVLFMRSGGTSRLAGFMVAALTFVVMMIGPYIIGYIPIMMVGVLIFDLGFELLLEALWSPRKKLKFLEFITVVVIVLVMGMYDFVVGIGIGIVLAFGSLIVQTSRISAVRSGFSGDAVRSTVRRNPSQQRYLREVGQQIHILRLSGFLFFGTVVSVEQEIRDLTADEEFEKHPIRFLLIDLWQVTGLDYSAGEAFNTISRLLDNRGISLVLSGLDPDSSLGQSLRAVGFGKNVEVPMLPDLNSALESCENELLKTFYVGQEAAKRSASSSPRVLSATNVDVPGANGKHRGDDSDGVHPFDMLASSPRRTLLRLAASRSLSQTDVARLSRWQSFKEPLRLLLQIFHGLSDRNEDFWFQAMGYFSRRELPAGTVLFHRGDRAECFYLLEKGILRAEYDLAHGRLEEAIVAGTTCGELPFFSDTPRTANVVVEQDCVLWLLDREGWARLQKEEPEVVLELLKISLKLTSERMSAITSYTLTVAT